MIKLNWVSQFKTVLAALALDKRGFILQPSGLTSGIASVRWQLKTALIYLSSFALCVLAACSSPPPARLPALLEQAQNADKEARRALQKGDLQRAQRSFRHLLTLQESLDDTAGTAITLVNLATVTHQLHDESGALAWLDKVLLEKASVYPVAAKTSATFRRAVILVSLNRLPEANLAWQQAHTACAEKCPEQFGILTLQARLLGLQGDALAAITLAQQLLKNGASDAEEMANVVRVLAQAEAQLLRYPESFAHFQQALTEDKRLGLSAHIAQDLIGLAQVAKQLGQEAESENYAHRAALVEQGLRSESTEQINHSP